MSNLFLGLLLVAVGIAFTVLLLRFTFSSGFKGKEAFIAIDGTKFYTKKTLEEYDFLYKSLECLYQEDNQTNRRNKILGLNPSFVNQIKNEGFSDLKTLISYKEDFIQLATLLDCKKTLEENNSNSNEK